MAKRVTGKSPAVATAGPAELTIELFAPGMSAMHRAGLGGLACTLKALEKHHQAGILREELLPGPFINGEYPWRIESHNVVLNFGSPAGAMKYLTNLWTFAFQIRSGMLYLPGQYGELPPSNAVLAEIQSAITRTMLQGAKKNITLGPKSVHVFDVDGSGTTGFTIELQRCEWFIQQDVWKVIVDHTSGALLEKPDESAKNKLNYGSLYPGAMKRHDKLNESDMSDTVKGLICVAFSLVGILAMKLNFSGDGLIIVPEVENLKEFIVDRPQLTPSAIGEIRIGGPADAAFMLETRLRARSMSYSSNLAEFRAIKLSLRTWTKPQKSRVESHHVDGVGINPFSSVDPAESEKRLDLYERALSLLPRGIRFRKDGESFWYDSSIRPLIATNLANRQVWHWKFYTLCDTTQKRSKIHYQRKGLGFMIKEPDMFDNGEKAIVGAVRAAMIEVWRKIEEVYKGREQLMMKKIEDEREKWGRVFATSLSLPLFRKNLADLLRRGFPTDGKPNWEVQKNTNEILGMLNKQSWQTARDLTLIALSASYFRSSTE